MRYPTSKQFKSVNSRNFKSLKKLITSNKVILRPHTPTTGNKQGYIVKPKSKLFSFLTKQSVLRNSINQPKYFEISNKQTKFYNQPVLLKMPMRSLNDSKTSLNRHRKSSFFVRHAANSFRSHLKTLSWALRQLKVPNGSYLRSLKIALPHINMDSLQLVVEQHLETISRRNLQRRLKRRRARPLKPITYSISGVRLDYVTTASVSTTSSTNLSTFGIIPSHNVYEHLSQKYADFPEVLSSSQLQKYLQIGRNLSPYVERFAKFKTDTLSPLLNNWSRLVKLYSKFDYLPMMDLYFQSRKAVKRAVQHLVRFKFNRNRLIISLTDRPTGLTHFFLSPGPFLRYFQKRKSLKKNKSMKLLMVRFLRKLLLLIRLKNILIHVRGVPVYLETLLQALFRPLPHTIPDLLSGSVVDEIQNPKRNLNFYGVRFINNKPFGSFKLKKKGRVKRKIRRKLYRTCRILD